MAVAVVQDWIEPETGRSTENYDAISEKLEAQSPPEGLILHTAGFTGQGFRIFEVWESPEHFNRFVEERLVPIASEVGADDAERPQVSMYELHRVVTI
jgi:hypothetical protein